MAELPRGARQAARGRPRHVGHPRALAAAALPGARLRPAHRGEAVRDRGQVLPVSHAWQKTPDPPGRLPRRPRPPGRGQAVQSARPGPGAAEPLGRPPLGVRVQRPPAADPPRQRHLTRQAYVEFDLEAMLDGEVYADFVAALAALPRIPRRGRQPGRLLAGAVVEGRAGAGNPGPRPAPRRRGDGHHRARPRLPGAPGEHRAARGTAGRAPDPPGLLPPAPAGRLSPALPVRRRGPRRPARPRRARGGPATATPTSTRPPVCGGWPSGAGGRGTPTSTSA